MEEAHEKHCTSIAHWAEEDRPREKLERLGAQVLSNAELLAILIGSGTSNESAVALMQRILNDCHNNLNTLGKLTCRELQCYKGVGPAKAITILAACELGKRRAMEKAEERKALDSAATIYEYLHPRMQDLDVEEAWVLLLNQHFRLIKSLCISHGGLSETHHVERSPALQCHCAGFGSQSSQQPCATQLGRRPVDPSCASRLRNHAHLFSRPCHCHRRAIFLLSRGGEIIKAHRFSNKAMGRKMKLRKC